MSDPEPSLLPKPIQYLLGWLAGPENREFVLGDLEEEFLAQPGGSGNRPKLWLWREAAKAAPGLMLVRLRAIDIQSIGLTVLLTFAAYLLLILWGAYVTRPIMIGLREIFPESQSIDYMFWYLPVRFAGIFLVGTIIAFLSFRKRGSFRQNFRQRLLLLLMVIIVPQFYFLVSASEDYSLLGGLTSAIVDGVALVSGAFFGGWLKRRRFQK